MASVTSDSHLENEDVKRKTVLEEKSKDDLIKIVKKQLTLLQKAKGKNDELNQKCVALEEEKKLFQDKQASSTIELEQQLEKLEINLSDLTEEKNKLKEEKNYEIKQLEERLKNVETEKTKYLGSLNENEERLQCLSMQLNTMKETCHCFQDELTKLQKNKLELEAEIIVLTEARDATLKSLKTQNLLLDSKSAESEDLKKKYALCIEENCSLTSTIENLETTMKNLQVENSNLLYKIENKEISDSNHGCPTNMDDFSFLIADNQKLQSEVNLLKEENRSLKQNTPTIENVTISDKSSETKDALDIRKEYQELQMNFINAESSNSKLRSAYEDLQIENKNLVKKMYHLEDEKVKANLDFDSALKENSELKEEVKKLASSLQEFSEFKTGYEYALLQGATTERIPTTDHESKNVNLEKIPESDKESGKTNQYFEMSFPEAVTGFEFGLLEGGDVSDMFQSRKRGDVNTDLILEKHPSDKGEMSDVKPNATNVEFQTIHGSTNTAIEMVEKSFHEEKVIEIERKLKALLANLEEHNLNLSEKVVHLETEKSQYMNKCNSLNEELELLKIEILTEKNELSEKMARKDETCNEYAALVEETISENESLKLKIEAYENEKCKQSDNSQVTHSSTNTTVEIVEKSFHLDKIAEIEMELRLLLSSLEEKNLNLSNQVSCLEDEKSENINKSHLLTEEIKQLKSEIQNFKTDIENLEHLKENVQQNSIVLEKQNYELSEKLDIRCKELEDINFQIEILAIGIKQGVRQKNSQP